MKGQHLEGVKLSQLRILIAVANYRNFGEAALHLQISQSAVSHAIAALEDELGIILVSRGRHGATLTPAGERILCHAQHIMEILDRIGKEAQQAKGLQGGQVRIAAFRSVATHVLPPAIAQFRRKFPGIQAIITENADYIATEKAVREGRADLCITYLPTSAEFETWELLRDEYVVLAPPDLTLAEPLTWDNIAQHPLILGPDNDACSIFVHKHFAKYGKSLQAAHQITEDSTILSMVSQGLGIAILPRLAAEPIDKAIQVFSLPDRLERVIGVGILSSALQPPPVFAFLDTLRDIGHLAKYRQREHQPIA
jgi:DNA-binding transcriptional LysR family regulator